MVLPPQASYDEVGKAGPSWRCDVSWLMYTTAMYILALKDTTYEETSYKGLPFFFFSF